LTKTTPTQFDPRRKRARKPLAAMQIAVIVAASLLFAAAAAFGGFLIYEEAQHQKALRNYPVAYTEWISKYADEYALDPYLVQSVMRCESSNDPNAVSGAGAIGLMQIMPDTGEWIAHKLDMDSAYTQEMLLDPETNIEFGCWYLGFLERRFDGDTKKMIAAYNAGHGSVEDWLEDPRFAQGGELLVIPFEDTARYYEKVTAAYENYTALYPDLFSKQEQGSVVAG
jgi:soluble lytic murein transglycosylase